MQVVSFEPKLINLVTTFVHNQHTCHCLAVVTRFFSRTKTSRKHGGLRADIIQGLEKYEITKIEGQPTEEDLTKLILELSSALGSVATTLGGGEHGHVGLIIDETEYVTFSRNGEKFVAPTNPGAYPASPDADAVVREQQIAEHKAKQDEFVTHQAVEAFARQAIAKAVEPEWLAEIKSDTMGYNHLTPKKMLTHLFTVGGTLDHLDVTQLMTHLLHEWDGIEAPAAYFAKGDRFERQLLKAGQQKNPELRLAFALTHFEKTGEFEPAIREWKALPTSSKTFAKFRVYIQKEFGERRKHDKSTAGSVGRGIANSVIDKQADEMDRLEAQALLLAELANTMAEQSQKQFKEMMEEFTKTLKSKDSPNPQNNGTGGKSKTKKKCPHCLMEVYHKPEKCFELEANASKRPEGWKSKKST